jgi:hypothetical protein
MICGLGFYSSSLFVVVSAAPPFPKPALPGKLHGNGTP